MRHLSGARLYGRLLALPTRIRLGWTGENALAYYKNLKIQPTKSFITLGPALDRTVLMSEVSWETLVLFITSGLARVGLTTLVPEVQICSSLSLMPWLNKLKRFYSAIISSLV